MRSPSPVHSTRCEESRAQLTARRTPSAPPPPTDRSRREAQRESDSRRGRALPAQRADPSLAAAAAAEAAAAEEEGEEAAWSVAAEVWGGSGGRGREWREERLSWSASHASTMSCLLVMDRGEWLVTQTQQQHASTTSWPRRLV